ncbi:NAD-dependent epimerase/dehydratase [Flammeovirgaceae bacterium 311]|nr:NAD-dependent epimerase/dehydratase [Flammeovirgaceae bacterium 311]
MNKHKNTPAVGIVQWFHIGEKEKVKRTITDLQELGVTQLRTGISWADLFSPEGKEWYDWLLPTLASHFELLPCFTYTPPSLGIESKISSPPRNLKDYADTMDLLITEYGEYFEYIELWNEPNNKSEWDYTLDMAWQKFAEMVGNAAYWAKQRGKKTVLGGMSPIDPSWLSLMGDYKLLQHIDVVGIHGFPDVFDFSFEGWMENIKRVQEMLNYHKCEAKIWITECGFSTWQKNELKQAEEFAKLLHLPLDRVYWYSLYDLEPEKNTMDGFHLDEREYSFGIKNLNGSPKLLHSLWLEYGLKAIPDKVDALKPLALDDSPEEKPVLITGGAGFVGTNMADYLLSQDIPVIIFDNLSRKGVLKNLSWLKAKWKNRVQITIADIRNPYEVEKAVQKVSHIYHFAAQVAVTTSVTDPEEDFEVNLKGTLNILNAMRKMENPPSLLYTSTNKVYGNLAELRLSENSSNYTPSNIAYKDGIDEDQPLSFHSPYGCSKGAADQYVSDYARIYNLKAVVFRMSCIYGPHQCGSEDQGWVANFLIRVLNDETINIYGNGKQVRDILYVEDLVQAMELARKNIDHFSGEAFNIGGGADNAVSLLEVLEIIAEAHGQQPHTSYGDWRPGDQYYYVSDFGKFQQATKWQPQISYKRGIKKLYQWLRQESPAENVRPLKALKA